MLAYCETFSEVGKPIPIPGYRFSRNQVALGEGELDETTQHAIEHGRAWAKRRLLEQIMEGDDVAPVLRSRPSEAAHLAHYFEAHNSQLRPRIPSGFSGPTRYQLRLLDDWATGYVTLGDTGHAAPPFVGDKRVHSFGARHIFEAHAQSVEGYEELSPDFVNSRAGFVYHAALSKTWDTYARDRVVGEQDRERVFATFAVLADLALYCPVGSVYSKFRTDQMSWIDMHPGYRFIKLLEKMGNSDWIDDVSADGRSLQANLSRWCGWKHPDLFLETGAMMSGASTQDRHAKACEIKLSRADRGIMWRDNNFIDILGQQMESTAPVFLEDEFLLHVQGDTANQRAQPLIEYAMHRLTDMVMKTGNVDLERLAPPGINVTDPGVTGADIVRWLQPLFPELDVTAMEVV